MKKKNTFWQVAWYIGFDVIASVAAWTLFFVYRKRVIEPEKFGYEVPLHFDENFILALIILPVFWVSLYFLTGQYKDIYRKSRLKELGNTFLVSVFGVVVIFFSVILDDWIVDYKSYYRLFYILLVFQFFLTYLPRLILTTRTNHRIQNRVIGFNTILIGNNGKALELYEELKSKKKSAGNVFIGFVPVNPTGHLSLSNHLERLGEISDLHRLVRENNVEEIIIALEGQENKQIGRIISVLEGLPIIVKVIPDMYDILVGRVRMSSIYGTPLIQISEDLMPSWQVNLKRMIDVVFSIIALLFLMPIYLLVAIGVKLSSPGPVLYSHERIGKGGKGFMIYKFRSMYQDAESKGPALSSDDDPRITPFGRFLRKSRLDETPQFFNVLRGDMSLVGPRPERQFYIDQIVEQAPHYVHLQKVKPGITSWGQVKFGYAENVEEMIKRLKYDLIYIANMSLYHDFKVLIYTVLIVLQGRGK